MPNYTWTVTATGNKIGSFSNVQSPDELTAANGWETKFGNITTTTPCVKARHDGNGSSNGSPLGIPLVTTYTFPVPSKAYGWGFLVLDMDVDQMDINATKPDGSSFTKAEINSWFKAVGDGDVSDGNTPPCWDATNATIVGSTRVGAPCTRVTTLANTTDIAGPYAYFEPDAEVKSLIFTYYNLQAKATPSSCLFLAAARTVTVTGTIFNDVNGITDGNINGTGTGVPSGTTLWAYLTNSSGKVVDSAQVLANGTYTFNPLFASAGTTSYNVVVSTTAVAIGTSNPPVALPTGWAAVGENIGTTYAAGNNDGNGAANQSVGISVGNANITNVNFAIQQTPESAVNSQVIGLNPGSTMNTSVNSSWFATSNVGANPNTQDYSTGTVNNIRITSFPTNATSITIGTTTYYPNAGAIPGVCPTATCLAWPGVGVTITAPGGIPSQTITVDPIDGLVTVSISFVAIDNAGIEDPTPGSISLQFTSILPVRLVSFTGTWKDNVAELKWEVADEINVNYYEIQFSINGTLFNTIGSISANGGNNQNYTYADAGAINKSKYYYRLKSVDNNGRFMNSSILQLFKGSREIITVFPSPTKGMVTISNAKIGSKIILSDLIGKVLQQITVTANSFTIDLSKYIAGVYLLKTESGVTQKIVKE